MKPMTVALFALSAFFTAVTAKAGPIAVGAAPKGDATVVASKIIKHNFPECKRVTGAVRASDGSIRAKCDGTSYLVFTVFNAKEGKVLELAMNCSAAKSLLGVSC
jgi:hypothetical protein